MWLAKVFKYVVYAVWVAPNVLIGLEQSQGCLLSTNLTPNMAQTVDMKRSL